MVRPPLPLVDQLYRVQGRAEIVSGRIVRICQNTVREGRCEAAILSSLTEHEEESGGGVAVTGSVAFLVDLPARHSFSPDVAWFACDPTTLADEFIQGAPTFAAELRSKDDYGPTAERAIRDKIAEYFAAGTLIVWDVDLQSEDLIKCYRASDPDHPQVFKREDIADAEPAVAGWRFPVKQLKRTSP